jgi:hypothetical protein
MVYDKPDFLAPIYGKHPKGAIWFVRFRPTGSVLHAH